MNCNIFKACICFTAVFGWQELFGNELIQTPRVENIFGKGAHVHLVTEISKYEYRPLDPNSQGEVGVAEGFDQSWIQLHIFNPSDEVRIGEKKVHIGDG